MTKYRLLIIDDDVGRHTGYQSMLGEPSLFELEFVQNRAELFQKIATYPAHAYVVDVRLWTDEDFPQVMKDIEGRAPALLISGRWGDPQTVGLLSRLDPEQRDLVVHFMSWEEFWDAGKPRTATAEATRLRLLHTLDRFYRRCSEMPAPDEDIGLLHLSDLQFGDPDVDPGSFLIEASIGERLRRDRIPVHLVVVTGDVSYSGRPDEYGEAAKWLNRLEDNLWPDKKQPDNLIVVPGNHDVDLRVCAAGVHDFDFTKCKLKPRPGASSSYWGFDHFEDFLGQVSLNPRRSHRPHTLFACNDYFMRAGIRLLTFNSAASVEISHPSKCVVPQLEMEELADQIRRADRLEQSNARFTVVVSHHGFAGAKYTGFENPDQVTAFLESSRTNLLLFGHGHGTVWSQRQHDPLAGLIEMMAPTMRLSARARSGDVRRGFHLITLRRKAGRVERVGLQPYEIDGVKVRATDVSGQVTEWTPREWPR
jgi:predicted phosphohydrolase